jgi:hypothetical protein
MENGCILLRNYVCQKFKCSCGGLISSKMECPLWGEAVEAKEYYDAKYRQEKGY